MTKVNRSTTRANHPRKSSVRKVERTISLATMIADIHRDRKNATITAKKARVYLRANCADIHTRNAGWMFTQSEYDRIRAVFDPAYAKTATRRARRAAKSSPAETPATTNA